MNDREKAARERAHKSPSVARDCEDTVDGHIQACNFTVSDFLAGATWQLEQRPRECLNDSDLCLAEGGDEPCFTYPDVKKATEHHVCCPMAGRTEDAG